MGCDIHPIIERHDRRRGDGGEVYWESWVNAGTPDLGRDYELFAVLAGVRNYDGITPVSEPRGLPGVTDRYEDGDFRGDYPQQPCEEFKRYYLHWEPDAHSTSWLTLAEIKGYDTTQEIEDRSVIVGRNEDGGVAMTARASYRRGRDVTAELERVGHRRVFSGPFQKEGEPTAWDRLIAELERAKRDGDTDDDVRLVFFFDN